MSKVITSRLISLIVIGVIVVGAFLFLSKGSKQTGGTETVAGYSTITSVAGCTFMINSAFAEQATAVTQITEGVDFETNEFYSYKNGKDQYMLFNLDNNGGLVVAVEKGTHFNLDQVKDEEQAVKNADVMGIWFDVDKEGLKADKDGSRTECVVKAQVVITNNLYNDYIGKLITIDEDEEEWAMFVGIPGDRYKNVSKEAKAGLETIANSFHRSDNTGEFEEPEYAVVIDGSDNTLASTLSENNITEDTETQVVAETDTDIETVEVTGVKETPSDDEIAVAEVTETTEVIEETEPVVTETPEEEETPQEAKEPQAFTQVPVPTPEPVKQEKRETVTTQSNVMATKWDNSKAYPSSPYSMLNIGQAGIFEATSKVNNGAEEMVVRVDKILGKEEAETTIRNAVRKGQSPLEYMDAPAGCHWEAAVYAVNFQSIHDNPYIDVRIVGADGKNLKYRGIKYPMTGHDLYTGIDKGDWKENITVYYAVPNGCKEYVLKVGDGDDINGWKSAYYYVVTK